MSNWFRPFLLAACLVLLFAAPAAAAAGTPVFADYTEGFTEYWTKFFKEQNGVVMGVLLVGAVALFIITRGKWAK